MSTPSPAIVAGEAAQAHRASPSGSAAFLQVYNSLATSGDLARMTGSALKVLSALGFASSPLGTGSPGSRAFFDDLIKKGVLSPADRGRLFCCLSHEDLVRLTGLSKNTITSCTSMLVRLGMVEKRVVHTRGFLRYNCFILLPASHVDKYHTLRPAAAAQPRRGVGSGEPPAPPRDAPPVPIPGSNLRKVNATITIDRVIALYESAIGPATPLVREELGPLVAQYPDPGEWDAAFRQAAWANVPRLSYVVKVLEGRAERRASQPTPGGEAHAPPQPSRAASRPGSSRKQRATPSAPDRRRDRSSELEAIRAAQERALSIQPLDYRAVLGVEHA